MDQRDTSRETRRPWIGPEYCDTSNRLGCRLLIVGESHHSKYKDDDLTAEDELDLTKTTVQSLINGEFRHSFFTKIAKLFGMESDVAGFWNQVAFHNFLQQIFDGPRMPVALTERQTAENRDAFFDVLSQLEPNRVLVLGKANWQFLPSTYTGTGNSICKASSLRLELPGDPCHEDDQVAYWYPTGEKTWALVGAVQHPSSGFSAQKLRPWIERFMKEPPLL